VWEERVVFVNAIATSTNCIARGESVDVPIKIPPHSYLSEIHHASTPKEKRKKIHTAVVVNKNESGKKSDAVTVTE
jgi:hydroxylamine reductase (hybrid-cluster protein)